MAQQVQQHGPGATGVVGVFHSDADAKKVAERAISLGIDPSNVRIGARDDHYRAIRSEMQEEMEQSWISPQFGVVYTKESAKTLTGVSLVAVVIGVVVMLPFAAVPIGDLELGWKLLIMAIVGAVLGITVGSIVGPAIGVKRPNEGLAADRGVVVRVSPANDAVEKMMATHDPIRIDRFDGEDLVVVKTEELSQGKGAVDEVKRNLANPKMESDPGYAPGEEPGSSDADAGADADADGRTSS